MVNKLSKQFQQLWVRNVTHLLYLTLFLRLVWWGFTGFLRHTFHLPFTSLACCGTRCDRQYINEFSPLFSAWVPDCWTDADSVSSVPESCRWAGRQHPTTWQQHHYHAYQRRLESVPSILRVCCRLYYMTSMYCTCAHTWSLIWCVRESEA